MFLSGQKICALLVVTSAVLGSFDLPDGRLGICRDSDDCHDDEVYQGPECSCENQVCCIGSGKAKSKCEEYGQFVYAEDYGAALSVRRVLQNVSHCHIEAVKLIVGGTEAAAMEFPHMAAVGYGDKPDVHYLCGGSLISPEYILTAAHCMTSLEHGEAKWVKLGALNVKETEENIQEFEIAKRIVHPRYKPPSRYDDIALLQLDKPAEMTPHVRPACLHIEPEIAVTVATATGWGKKGYSEATGSPDLMKVLLSVIGGSPCEDMYKTDVGGAAMNRGVIASQFCAGELAGGKDTCQGDSGGPLQTVLATPYCMYSVVGVTSFGKFCAFANAPAVYTRISHYVPWIESIVWS